MWPEPTSRSIGLYLLAAAVIATFAVVGLYHVAQALPNYPHLPAGATDATTDLWLAAAVGGDRPSETLRDALKDIPGDGVLLFVADASTDYSLTHYSAEYLAGLRPMTLLVCQADGRAVYRPSKPRHVDAVLIMDPSTSPPPGGQRVGPGLAIIPTTGEREWSSYCP
ncbi:MAG: hypothetical protein U0641_02615 [Anaerolineae bacterium]